MPATYEPIATTTISGTTNTVTFSSIPATYTDIRIAVFLRGNFGSVQYILNSDTATNYSHTIFDGDGTTISSGRATSISYMLGTTASTSTFGVPTLCTLDLFNYAGSTNKTALGSQSFDRNGAGIVSMWVTLWRSTSAVNSIQVNLGGGTDYVGSVVTLYGIKAA